MKNIYEILSKNSLVEWFTRIGELKHGVKQSILKETTYIGDARHVYILSKFPTFEKKIIVLLKATFVCCNSVRNDQNFHLKKGLKLLNYNNNNGFIISLSLTQNFVCTKILD